MFLKKDAKVVNMDISKLKMKLVFIVVLKNMEDQLVLNVDMKFKMELKQIILYVKIVIL